ncbi:uncharacterized protein PV07_01974 [Cladophialophora immunda]|uniref:NAD-dependent epimerase/dehydratase domain-containing protein n=1 Tax=Cladophialophora immunda TaxID=569365 RepID=A0A0D2CZ76_9EURO|nr:uncharacterized protein PV07_01974 [Cladophialophora immunda]KIW35270.1 hypothetical protein PV07_01974 [Cladophialophora immunda]
MGPPTAIVTGGLSGIGNALVRHLVSLNWRVVVADINPPRSPCRRRPGRPVQASVCVERAAGFVALNAGVDHGDDVLENLSGDVDRPPSKPDTRPFEVNVTGAFYGIKLAAHYMTVPSTHAGTPKSGGKIIITASGGGIFPIPILAQHTASKHPLIGLV